MTTNSAKTVTQYLKLLRPEQRKVITQIRSIILETLPKGYHETIQYGMISYVVPLSLFPQGYLNDKTKALPYIAVAAQKNHFAIYLTTIYSDKKIAAWFKKNYEKSGKKMDVGKSCVRFKKIEDLPLKLIAQAVKKTSPAGLIKLYKKYHT